MLRFLFVPILFAFYAMTVRAQTLPVDTAHTIDEIIVRSRPSQREIIAPRTLKGDALDQLSSGSIADALRYFAGLQLKDYGGVGGLKTVDIRSMGTHHLGIFYDGIELGNAQNGQIDLGQFALDNVEEISLYNGQKSALLQSAADFGNAGNIYIRTRRPIFFPGERYHVRLNAKYGSSDLFSISSLWEQRVSSRVSTSLNACFLSSSGRYRFRYKRVRPDGGIAYDTIAVRQNGDIRAFRTELNINGTIQHGFWNAKLYAYESERGIPGAIVNNVWRRGERQNDLNVFFQGRFQRDITSRFSTRWMTKYAYYRTHYANRDTTQLPVDNRFWQQEAYISTTNAYEILPGWSASLAYDFKWNKLNADVYRFVFPQRKSHFASFATSLERWIIGVQASVLGIFVNDRLRAGSQKNISRFVPALFLNIRPFSGKTVSFRAFAKQSFRMPTFNDLYYTDVGNAALRPEKATQFDIGASLERSFAGFLKNISVQTDVYYNMVDDKIIAYPKGQQFRWTMLNLGKVDIRGLDFSSALKFIPFRNSELNCRLQYTFQSARDVTSSSTSFYHHQIPYIPRHSGSLVLNFDYCGWHLNYSFIYTGERYNEQENIQYNYMQPWYTHDASLQYDFRLKNARCKAILEVNNLFDQKYDVILNYPMPGLNGAIALRIDF